MLWLIGLYLYFTVDFDFLGLAGWLLRELAGWAVFQYIEATGVIFLLLSHIRGGIFVVLHFWMAVAWFKLTP